jgi:hypothetical protein
MKEFRPCDIIVALLEWKQEHFYRRRAHISLRDWKSINSAIESDVRLEMTTDA